jgi:prepilin-type N-terminal cleavage/methylation domain-containing protein
MQLKTRNSQKGFTLIEIMVVILIVAGVLAVGGTRLFNPNENRRSQIRKLAIQTKELRTSARLQNATFRFVFEMDDKNGHRYWVESAAGQPLQFSEAQEEELEKLTEIQREEALKGRTKFEKDSKHKEVVLNGGLVFEGIEINGRSREFTEGRAYVHFFPQGLSDEAVIKLGDRKQQHWSIVIHPLTGAAEILNRSVTLKELKAK